MAQESNRTMDGALPLLCDTADSFDEEIEIVTVLPTLQMR